MMWVIVIGILIGILAIEKSVNWSGKAQAQEDEKEKVLIEEGKLSYEKLARKKRRKDIIVGVCILMCIPLFFILSYFAN
jgi:uncharacterized membrane protein YcaP (DUF421 family)